MARTYTRSVGIALLGMVVVGMATLGFAPRASADRSDEGPFGEESDPGTEEIYEEEFCGGDPSPLDEAEIALYEGDPALAEHMAAALLRRGGLETWERTRAHLLLGEAQLLLGKHWGAAHNLGRVFQRDAESYPSARLAHAIALYHLGKLTQARDTLRTFDATCDARAPSARPEACLTAAVVRRALARDTSEATHHEAVLERMTESFADLAPLRADVERFLAARGLFEGNAELLFTALY